MERICKEMGYLSKLYHEHLASQRDSLSAKYSALGQFFAAAVDEYLCI